MEEKYHIQNTITKLFLKGFKSNKPLWAELDSAATYNELEALKLQRRLEYMYLPYQKIVLVEKN